MTEDQLETWMHNMIRACNRSTCDSDINVLKLIQHIENLYEKGRADEREQTETWDTSDMAHRPGGLSVEQTEKQEKLCKYCGGIGRVVCDGRCMPEQEPSTWAETNDLVCALLRQAHDVLACASYPFKHPWVGLTEEEIDAAKDVAPPNLGGEYYREDVEKIARAIEAKLKEKNGG